MILPAQAIRRLCQGARPMVFPFHERTREHGVSFGLSAAGYDVRIAETVWVWPLWGRLASTIERFDIPDDLVAEIKDKSTWARRFVLVQNTVAEPGWRGYLTLELTRVLPWPIRIRRGTAIAQMVFKRLETATEQPYGAGDKYQDQREGPQPAILSSSNRSIA